MKATSGVAHLHVHSAYSFLDGTIRHGALAEAAVRDEQPAVANTDHGTLAGIWRFAKAARAAGVKPICGMEGYLAIGRRFDQDTLVMPSALDTDADAGGTEKRYHHLTMLAATPEGWRNLVCISNIANRDGFWYKPRFDWEVLAEHGKGLVLGTGCLGGPVASAILRDDLPAAREAVARLVDIAGRDGVFVEVMDHGIPEEAAVLSALVGLAREFSLPVVATNDAHYLCEEDQPAHSAWLSIGSKGKFQFHGSGYHLKTAAQMHATFDHLPGCERAVENTLVIAERIADDVLPEAKLRLPHFNVPEGFADSVAYLHHLVREGAVRRYGTDWPADLAPALRYEFDVVAGAGLADYFLIVWDLVTWARSQGITVGPGRGSAAGSLISYCLGITNVEPRTNGLLFERFLNPERVGMPDIDIDFEKAHKARITDYLSAKYGADRVARLATYGVSRSRASIKSAARVLGQPPSLGDRLSKLVPLAGGRPLSFDEIDDAGAATETFRAVVDSDPKAGEVVALARRIEGLIANPGIHACAVIVSDTPFDELGIPVRIDRKGDGGQVVEWDGKDAGDPSDGGVGLLKLDRLALRNLDIARRCVDDVARLTGEIIDLDALDADEPGPRADAVWTMLAEGRTAGVFQLESAGMTKLCEGMAPRGLGDLSALVALYRPGPMGEGMHDKFVARKRGFEPVSYDYLTTVPSEVSVIESILGPTYGVLVYQEQLQQLARAVAGFSPGQSNLLLKGFAKKRKEVMDALEGPFLTGGTDAVAADGTPKVAFQTQTLGRLWATFKASSDYLFNKAHSASYGAISYMTAYLKANWPAAYAAALLSLTDRDDKRQAIMADLRAEGIAVLGPDVNKSQVGTAVEDGAVRFGLAEIKGVGTNAQAIVSARAEGPYTSLADMIERTKVNATVVDALICGGACDAFGPRRGLLSVARALKTSPSMVIPDLEWGTIERAARERDRLGVLLGEHPLVVVREQVAAWRDPRGGAAPIPVHQIGVGDTGKTVAVIGVLAEWAESAYSGGRRANFVVEGSRGALPGVMWNREVAALKHSGTMPSVGDLICVIGQVTVREFEVRLDGRGIDEVDEDDETETMVETITRVEMRASRIVPVTVDDPGRVQLATVTPLRRPEESWDAAPSELPVTGPGPDEALAEVIPLHRSPTGAEWAVEINPDDLLDTLSTESRADRRWRELMPVFATPDALVPLRRAMLAGECGDRFPITTTTKGVAVVFVVATSTDLETLDAILDGRVDPFPGSGRRSCEGL